MECLRKGFVILIGINDKERIRIDKLSGQNKLARRIQLMRSGMR